MFVALLCCLSLPNDYSSSDKVHGVVTQVVLEDGAYVRKAIDGAWVSLYNTSDKESVTCVETNSCGSFDFGKRPAGLYYICVKSMYKTAIQEFRVIDTECFDQPLLHLSPGKCIDCQVAGLKPPMKIKSTPPGDSGSSGGGGGGIPTLAPRFLIPPFIPRHPPKPAPPASPSTLY